VPQAEWLVGWLRERGHSIGAVVNLLVPDAELIGRIAGRRSCLSCGATYHVTASPPGTQGRCTACGGDVVQRADDREDVVQARLVTYARETAPVLGVLRGASDVHDVDGTGAIADVQGRIFSALSLG
jgi:adenylate kinase